MSSMSSMYIIILLPQPLSRVIRGFITLVKVHGAHERPNGRQVNWYNIAFPLKTSETVGGEGELEW